jgi:hypothetical protein
LQSSICSTSRTSPSLRKPAGKSAAVGTMVLGREGVRRTPRAVLCLQRPEPQSSGSTPFPISLHPPPPL